MKTKTTITEKSYTIETEGIVDTEALADYAKALELSLSDLPSRRGASGKTPGAITACHASDDRTVLTYIAEQQEPRARKYIQDNCPGIGVKAVTAALTRLIKAGELELKPATYKNASGQLRPIQGVFFTGTDDEKPKGFLNK